MVQLNTAEIIGKRTTAKSLWTRLIDIFGIISMVVKRKITSEQSSGMLCVYSKPTSGLPRENCLAN